MFEKNGVNVDKIEGLVDFPCALVLGSIAVERKECSLLVGQETINSVKSEITWSDKMVDGR